VIKVAALQPLEEYPRPVAGRIKLLRPSAETACAVPAWHAVHGKRLLGLRPYDLPLAHRSIDRPGEVPAHDGPVELYVSLPNEEVNIVYGWKRLSTFRVILREILDSIG